MSTIPALPTSTETCKICNETADILDLVPTDCGHLFHEACIGQWVNINPTCPLDKERVRHIGNKDLSQFVQLETCQVCQEEAPKSELTPVDCSHLFHEACIGRWAILNPKCPICRKDIHVVVDPFEAARVEAAHERERRDQEFVGLLNAAARYGSTTHLRGLLQRSGIRQEWLGSMLREAVSREAVSSDRIDTISFLLNYGEPGISDRDRGGALVLAAANGNYSIVQALLAGNPTILIEDLGLALQNAAANQHRPIIQALLANNPPISPNHRGKVVELIEWHEVDDLLKLVLPEGAEIPSVSRGKAIEKASNKDNSIDLLEFLLPKGAEIPKENRGKAVENVVQRWTDSGGFIDAFEKKLRLLLPHGVEIPAENLGRAVEKAATWSNVPLFHLLLPEGADIPEESRGRAVKTVIDQFVSNYVPFDTNKNSWYIHMTVERQKLELLLPSSKTKIPKEIRGQAVEKLAKKNVECQAYSFYNFICLLLGVYNLHIPNSNMRNYIQNDIPAENRENAALSAIQANDFSLLELMLPQEAEISISTQIKLRAATEHSTIPSRIRDYLNKRGCYPRIEQIPASLASISSNSFLSQFSNAVQSISSKITRKRKRDPS